MDRIRQIREKERLSHMDAYSNHILYQEGSWLHKPVKTVLELLPYFDSYSQLRVLDLGCGIGRNCISIAQRFQKIQCRIDCVDILPFAIEKLNENAERFHVSAQINGIVGPLDSFPIPDRTYDLILAVSALEHADSEETFLRKLTEIKSGIRKNGIVCLIINSNVREFDKQTGEEVPAQFEVNLPGNELEEMVHKIFHDWAILKEGFRDQQYDIPRENSIRDLHTSVYTFVAQKRNEG